MQILTKFAIVCALAATVIPFSSRGADTDAQMKAREALRQKLSEMEAQPVVTNAAPPAAPSKTTKAPKTKSTPAPVVEKPTAAPAPTPVSQPVAAPAETVKSVPEPTPAPAPAVESTPTPAPAPVVKTTRPKPAPVTKTTPASGQMTASRPDSERIAKARQALEEKMREIDSQGVQPATTSQPSVASQPPASQPAAASQPPVASQPPPSRPVVASQPPPASASTPVFHAPEISSTSQPTTAVETSEPLPTPPPVKRSAEADSKPQKSKKPSTSKPQPEPRPTYQLPQGPPPPVSAEKVQKLNTLLQQYQADRITPEQYHQERAKILAGP